MNAKQESEQAEPIEYSDAELIDMEAIWAERAEKEFDIGTLNRGTRTGRN